MYTQGRPSTAQLCPQTSANVESWFHLGFINSSSWSLCYALPTYAHPGHTLCQQKQAVESGPGPGLWLQARLSVADGEELMRRPHETPEEFCKHVGFPAKENSELLAMVSYPSVPSASLCPALSIPVNIGSDWPCPGFHRRGLRR